MLKDAFSMATKEVLMRLRLWFLDPVFFCGGKGRRVCFFGWINKADTGAV